MHRADAQALAAATARAPLDAPQAAPAYSLVGGATCALIRCSCRRVLVSGVGGNPAKVLLIRTYSLW